MPLIDVESADQATVDQFEENYNQFSERFENGRWNNGTNQAAPIIITDGGDGEEEVSENVKQEIDNEIAGNFDIGIDPRQEIYANDAVVLIRGAQQQLMERNQQIHRDHYLEWYFVQRIDDVVGPGDLLEIEQLPNARVQYYCTFLRVQTIYKTVDGVVFRGIPYTRTRNTIGMLDYQRNELVEVLDIDNDDKRDWDEQAQVEIDESVIIIKRNLVITNAQWPDFACDYREFDCNGTRTDEEGHLTCRWRMITLYRDARHRKEQRPFSRTLYHLSRKDVQDREHRVPDDFKLNSWRGGKIRGGSHNPNRHDRATIDLESRHWDDSELVADQEQKYTFGDMFCGAGGASRGAKSAGLKVSAACDIDGPSCQSYRLNFPDVHLHEENISDFVGALATKALRFDFLHISPPCQYWSPAHTNPGKNDEQNRAILMATQEIIYKFRPRIATVEQTYGILRARHTQFFHMLLNCFTSNGYSVTWKYVVLEEWGVPQPRKRLIIIASCPGEVHPDMPGPSDGLRSVNQIISRIGPRANHHNPQALLNTPGFPKLPWNGNGILRRTFTCTGGSDINYHPNGLRPFTTREIASLQTFPIIHQFTNTQTQARKQIGNAFPPLAVEWLYKNLLDHVKRVDNVFPTADREEDNDDDVVFLGTAMRR